MIAIGDLDLLDPDNSIQGLLLSLLVLLYAEKQKRYCV